MRKRSYQKNGEGSLRRPAIPALLRGGTNPFLGISGSLGRSGSLAAWLVLQGSLGYEERIPVRTTVRENSGNGPGVGLHCHQRLTHHWFYAALATNRT